MRIKNTLDFISENCFSFSFDFNTSKLVNYSGKGSESDCPVWKQLGIQFMEIKSPVVYWFTFSPLLNGEEVFKRIKAFKENQPKDERFRYLPALKSRRDEFSNTLYVGCCGSTKLIDRMFWHFGYYKTGRTQGLQLCHWSKSLNLNVTIDIIQFPIEAKELIYVYEKMIADKLNPITGKH